MKRITILILLLSVFDLFSWGPIAHHIISGFALENLPSEMNFPAQWTNYIIKHSMDPDYRKDDYLQEEKKHFIDLDFYDEFNKGEMIYSYTELVSKYGVEQVHDMGTLPWTIQETYQKLILAFKEMNEQMILLSSSDLAHYLADGSQPLHTVLNYNGRMSGQRGIHGRYETEMIARFAQAIQKDLLPFMPQKISITDDLVFNYLFDSNSLAPVIFAADLHALKYSDQYDDFYYSLFWFRTSYITKLQIRRAAKMLCDMIFSAWLAADSPKLSAEGE